MSSYTYPHTIENGAGEQLTFLNVLKEDNIEYHEVENIVQPGSGPPMHVHFKQAESLTIVKGFMGVQILGEGEEFFVKGDTITFEAGIPHRFWNAGEEPLHCKGWVKPAHNIEYFLTEIYKSTKANKEDRPGNFDAAYLMSKYRSEFDMLEIPSFVKKIIFPLTLFFGKLLGKHKKFLNSPNPIK